MLKINFFKRTVQALCLLSIWLTACSNPSTNKREGSPAENKFYAGKGTGPINNIVLPDAIDNSKAEEGKKLFEQKCVTCHEWSDIRRIGPGLEGVTKRRTPEWIMNQMLNPSGMTKTDSLAKELLLIYQTQMTDMDLSESDARNILEYFRRLDVPAR